MAIKKLFIDSATGDAEVLCGCLADGNPGCELAQPTFRCLLVESERYFLDITIDLVGDEEVPAGV